MTLLDPKQPDMSVFSEDFFRVPVSINKQRSLLPLYRFVFLHFVKER